MEDLFKVTDKLWNVRLVYYITTSMWQKARRDPTVASEWCTREPGVVSAMRYGLLVSGRPLLSLPSIRFPFIPG